MRIASAFGPWAPSSSVCSMSPVRDGPVTKLTVDGKSPARFNRAQHVFHVRQGCRARAAPRSRSRRGNATRPAHPRRRHRRGYRSLRCRTVQSRQRCHPVPAQSNRSSVPERCPKASLAPQLARKRFAGKFFARSKSAIAAGIASWRGRMRTSALAARARSAKGANRIGQARRCIALRCRRRSRPAGANILENIVARRHLRFAHNRLECLARAAPGNRARRTSCASGATRAPGRSPQSAPTAAP